MHWPLPSMLALMTAKSIVDAVHVFLRGKASFGGGPVGSACDEDEFEFLATKPGGGFASVCSASTPVSLKCAGLQSAQDLSSNLSELSLFLPILNSTVLLVGLELILNGPHQ